MIVPMAGGEARALTSDPSDTAPMFTRDGADVVFERTAASGETSIFVVPAAGGEPRAIALGSQPAASPSDDTIAFVTAADDGGARQVMLTGRSGGLVRAVPRLERAAWQRPRFSADGKRLVVVRGFQQIVAVTLDGSEAPATIWTATTGSVSAAEFARDGDGVIAAVASYDGDLWLAEGTFP
jgi:Tol biopolymer transport system component